MVERAPDDGTLQEAVTLLRRALARLDTADDLVPWAQPPARAHGGDRRISATDMLTWWFRPAAPGRDPWDAYFDAVARPPPAAADPVDPVVPGATPVDREPLPPGRLASLRLLLDEDEDELLDSDADAVVACLYDFVHAVGRRDLGAAMASVHADYHVLEDDREVDRSGLAGQLRGLLDSLRGWDIEASLVEIPQPMLHPAGILVYAELQVEARKPVTGERRTVVQRRVAVFDRAADGTWQIVGLSPWEKRRG